MMLVQILPLLLSGLLLAGPPAAPPALAVPDTIADSLRELRRWQRRDEPVEDERALERAREALVELDLAWSGRPDRREEIQLALLDFLGRSLRVADPLAGGSTWEPGAPRRAESGEEELRRLACATLRLRLEAQRSWLTLEVLLGERDQPPERRVAACEIIARDRSPEVVLALFSCTRSELPEVRAAAVEALCGREAPEVHRRLIELLAQAERGEVDVPIGALERHFRGASVPSSEVATVERIAEYVDGALADESWRRASRGVTVARCLPHDAAFPPLILAMETWLERADGERPVRRVLGELEAELRRRSGRGFGLHPTRWKALWEGYRRGDLLFDEGKRIGQTVSRAQFFGLRPVTDRVVFVLDRSGSMDSPFAGCADHNRLREAAEQLAEFLGQLGPDARFSVVTFSDRASTWQGRLKPATLANIRSAAGWVLSQGARGGTKLRAGVLAAMHVDDRGRIDLEALEADTVIVLCDGATEEGPEWVEPLLRRVNAEARLVFHAVQIGRGGDGTLQALCELTGGKFALVDG